MPANVPSARITRTAPSSALLLAGALLLVPASGAQDAPSDLAPYLMPDRAAEVALARSAAPRAVSDGAAVLVLTRTGYVEAAPGGNGFTCLVVRSFEGPLDQFSEWWNPKVRAPHCLNGAAVRTVLPEIERRASLVLQGKAAPAVAAEILAAYARHELAAPETGAMAYMLSHEQVLGDRNPHWLPHVMFYFGGGHQGSEWGAGGSGAPILDGGTDPAGVNVLLIPVPQWSDGTPASHTGH